MSFMSLSHMKLGCGPIHNLFKRLLPYVHEYISMRKDLYSFLEYQFKVNGCYVHEYISMRQERPNK